MTSATPAGKVLETLKHRSLYSVAVAPVKPGEEAGAAKLPRFIVSYGPHEVRLYLRAGTSNIWIQEGPEKKTRRSTKSSDWIVALAEAERVISDQVRALHDETGSETTAPKAAGRALVDLVTWFRETPKWKGYGEKTRSQYERIFAILRYKFDYRHSASRFRGPFVAEYVRLRTTTSIVFPAHYGRRKLGRIARRKAVDELKYLSTLFGYAASKDQIEFNPLAGYTWDEEFLRGDVNAVEHFEEAQTERHRLLLVGLEGREAPIHRVDAWDGGVRLRALECLLFHHAHRGISCLSLMCEDVAFTSSEARKLLRGVKNHPEWWADHWPHGAIVWRRSKEDYLRVTPMSAIMASELRALRDAHPCWATGYPVFTQMRDPSRALGYDQAYKWMRQALEIARSDATAEGLQGRERMLSGSVLHGWRGHWATIMDRLGYGWEVVKGNGSKLNLHNHVAFMGDWAVGGGTQDEIYAKLHPGVLLAIAEFERARDVSERFSVEASESIVDTLGAIYQAPAAAAAHSLSLVV